MNQVIIQIGKDGHAPVVNSQREKRIDIGRQRALNTRILAKERSND
jgi:hypothetical protein